MRERYSWSRILSNPCEETIEGSSVPDYLFDNYILTHTNYDEWRKMNEDHFPDYIRRAPYLFSVINQVLTECKLSPARENLISNFAKLFMTQPLPHSIVPLETYRIVQNEKLLPGHTKVLSIVQDFPQLNWQPEKTMKSHDVTVYNQIGQVFVYEESLN